MVFALSTATAQQSTLSVLALSSRFDGPVKQFKLVPSRRLTFSTRSVESF